MFDFAQANMLVNLSVFTVAAVIVWFAGGRITGYVIAISSKTGIGQSTIGLLLLGGVTSLPEIGVTVGMAERGDQTILRMGLDSVAVLVCYFAGLLVLYFLR